MTHRKPKLKLLIAADHKRDQWSTSKQKRAYEQAIYVNNKNPNPKVSYCFRKLKLKIDRNKVKKIRRH